MDHSVNFSGVGLALVILAAASWAMSGIFINFITAGSDVSAWGLAFWRDGGTAVILLIGLRLFRPDWLRVQRGDWPWLALMGALGIGLLHAAWNMSVIMNGTAVATVLQYNAPILVFVAAFMIWREPLTGRKIAAIVLAFAGTVLVARMNGPVGAQITLPGLLVGLGTAVSFGAISLFGKKLSGDYNAWTILAYAFAFGALALLPFQVGRPLPHSIEPGAWLAFAGLLLVSTIGGFTVYTIGLGRLQASVAVIVATMEVPFAAFAAYTFLGEQLDIGQGLGAALVVSGVILLSLRSRKRIPSALVVLEPLRNGD